MIAERIRLSRFDPKVTYSATTTWTSISDVGSTFDDGMLTMAEYQRVESAYLEAIKALYQDAGSPQLAVGDVEITPTSAANAGSLINGSLVAGARFLEICRWVLREELSCRLDAEETFYIHFGFDYYVYVGLEAHPVQTVIEIQRLGLFLERDMLSPYAEIDGDASR